MKEMLSYLSKLNENNNSEWFHANKDEYKAATAAFEDFVGGMILEIGKFDPSVIGNEPKSLTFKLMRDTRFSNDKSPYNPAFRAHISAKGKLPIPVGYFIVIKPNNQSFLGGGLFADMFKNATAMVRDYIAENPEALEAVISDDGFKSSFSVMGTKLKNVPNGYDRESPAAEFLKHKSWFLEYPITDEQLLRDDFIPFAAEIFGKMKPFNDYLNRALVGFQMPTR